MIDIHSHLLHGLDDGSKTLENSVAMARMAAADGITHMVCTPHASGAYTFSPEAVAAKLAELRAAIAAEDIGLQLGSGCDFHLSFDNLEDAQKHPGRYTINGHQYLLVELPDYGVPASLPDLLYNLRIHGMTPILTHPERNATVSSKLEMLAPLLRDGLLIQLTANSLTGDMGRHAEKTALKLLANGWVHFVSTDSHNLTSRPPILSRAFDLVRQKAGDTVAEQLFTTNPLAAFNGTPIDAPDPWEIGRRQDEKPSFWKRLFGGH
jgi:protein-tyrosine phosphatase